MFFMLNPNERWCNGCQGLKDEWHAGKHICADCCRAQSIAYNRALRLAALHKLGARCACCGEEEVDFLQFDHVNDDGWVHRRQKETGSNRNTHGQVQKMYREIAAGTCKFHIQVLCANCNWAKSRDGCPHRRPAKAASWPN